ncbi:MAG TPA: HD domain-containing protein [Fibrobacteria bacterium]|nr:HD domain-containing protein [Fibrobacteria bacterium]
MPPLLPQPLLTIAADVNAAGGQAYLVGGWVRDYLMGSPSGDYDIEVYGLALDPLLAILKKHGKPNLVGKAFGVITMTLRDGSIYDIAFPRTEKKVGDGHRGFDVTPDPTLDFATASSRRDFTVNAMGLRLPDLTLVDCHGGRADLEARLLRHVSPAFSEDPLRALRAVQFAARFEFDIHPATQALCAAQPLEELPRERLFAEFRKLMLRAARPSIGFEWLRRMDMLRYFPELAALVGVPQEPEWHPEGDVWTHTMMVVDQAARLRSGCATEGDALALMFGALCHDLGKPSTTVYKDGRWRSPAHEGRGDKPTRAFLARLTNETGLVEEVTGYVREHLKPSQLHKVRDTLRPAAIRRLALRVDIEKLVRLARADHLGRTTEEALAGRFPAGDWLLEESRNLDVLAQKPVPFLTGKYLLSLGLKPGPELGKIIAESFELQLEGELADRAAAEAWARQKVGGW